MHIPPQPISGIEAGRWERSVRRAIKEYSLSGTPDKPPVSDLLAVYNDFISGSATLNETRTIYQCRWSSYCGITDDNTVDTAILDHVGDVY